MSHWTDRLFKEQADSYAQFFDRRFESAKDDVDDLLSLLDDERDLDPQRVLDVACGTGRHVIAFAETGRTAEGLDFSADFVESARDRAFDEGVEDDTTFHVHDMRDLDEFDGSFDLVTCFWNSLGYYDKDTDVEMLAEIERLLEDSGALLMEVGNKEFYVRELKSSSVREVDGSLHVEQREFDVETARFRHTLDLFEVTDDGYDHRESMEWEYRSYAPVELVEMCERAGFESVDLFGSLDGEELTLESPTTYVLAR